MQGVTTHRVISQRGTERSARIVESQLLTDEVYLSVANHEEVGDVVGRQMVGPAEVRHEGVLVVEPLPVDVAEVGRLVDRHRPWDEVVIAPTEEMQALVLRRRNGHDGVDPRPARLAATGRRGGGRRARRLREAAGGEGEERDTSDEPHGNQRRSGVAESQACVRRLVDGPGRFA